MFSLYAEKKTVARQFAESDNSPKNVKIEEGEENVFGNWEKSKFP